MYSLNFMSDMLLKCFCHHHQPPCLINTWGPFAIDLDYLVLHSSEIGSLFLMKCSDSYTLYSLSVQKKQPIFAFSIQRNFVLCTYFIFFFLIECHQAIYQTNNSENAQNEKQKSLTGSLKSRINILFLKSVGPTYHT